MLKALALALLFITPAAFAGKHSEKNRAPASLRECKDAKCPLNMIHCEQGTHRVDVRKPGSCCPKWKCEDNEGVDENECKDAKCPMLSPPRCKPNEMIKSDGVGCCPKPICVPRTSPDCARVRCMQNMIHCKPGEKPVDVREDGACCPKWKCEKKAGRISDKCNNIACTMQAPPTCSEGQVLINKAGDEACCPDWECMDDESEDL